MAVRLAQTQPHNKTMTTDDTTEYTPTWIGRLDPRDAAEWIAVARDDTRDKWHKTEGIGYYSRHALVAGLSLENVLWTLYKSDMLPQYNWRVVIYHNGAIYGRLVMDDEDETNAEPWGIWTDPDDLMWAEEDAEDMLRRWTELAASGVAYCVRALRPWEARNLYTERDANCNDYVQVYVTRLVDMHDEHGSHAGQAPVVDAYRLRAMMHKTAGVTCTSSEALTSDAGTVYELTARGENTLEKLLESWRIPADVRLMDTDTDGVNIFRATVIERRQA